MSACEWGVMEKGPPLVRGAALMYSAQTSALLPNLTLDMPVHLVTLTLVTLRHTCEMVHYSANAKQEDERWKMSSIPD